MPPLSIRVINKLRKIACHGNYDEDGGMRHVVMIHRECASDLIYDMLMDDQPRMITRFGRTELRIIRRYYNYKAAGLLKRSARYIIGRTGPFWWDDSDRQDIMELSGVFPSTNETLEKFSKLNLEILPEIDILASWCAGEWDVRKEIENANLIGLLDLEPFRNRQPWSRALAGKRVLVVHPFEKTIRSQYEKRELLFEDPELLPEFELDVLPAVQSLSGGNGQFKNWFEALDYMKDEMAKREFDVALIGAGAYGMPLAAHAKALGKKGLHFGGATQLMFGIRGKRWDDRASHNWLINEHWVRPAEEEKPKTADKVEGACYW
jgi:hypothetical protein